MDKHTLSFIPLFIFSTPSIWINCLAINSKTTLKRRDHGHGLVYSAYVDNFLAFFVSKFQFTADNSTLNNYYVVHLISRRCLFLDWQSKQPTDAWMMRQ